MKFNHAYIIPVILLLFSFNTSLSDRKNILDNPNSDFPVNKNIMLVCESSFGESVTKYFQDDGVYTTVTNKVQKRQGQLHRKIKWFENEYSELNKK